MTLTVDPRKLATGINHYVPAMAFDASLIHGQPSPFSLGSPAVSTDNLISTTDNAQAVAGTVVSKAYTADSPYGRTLIMTPSGNPGNSFQMDVYGFDWLGQPMIERFTGASGSTSILYGQKAFYKVSKTQVKTASTNAITVKVGTGLRCGLPFKGDVAWAQENAITMALYKRSQWFYADRSAVLAVAGGSKWVRSPFPGYVATLVGIPDGGGGGTDPVITVELANVAIVGLTVTVDTSDANGTTVTDTPTTVGYNANNRFVANGNVELVGAAAAGAFGDRLGVELVSTQVIAGDTTDPATATTGDPRGTYESLTLLAAFEIVVGLIGDSSVNASGNGGLHGIKHVAS